MHVNDGEAIEVSIQDLEGSQDAGQVDSLVDDGVAGATRSACLVVLRLFMVGLLVGGRPGQLLSDNAAERQERPMAIGLSECLPEVRQRTSRRGPPAAGDRTSGTMSHGDPPSSGCTRRSWLQSRKLEKRRYPNLGSGAEDRQG